MSDAEDRAPEPRGEPDSDEISVVGAPGGRSEEEEESRLLETGRLAELGLLSAGLVHELRQPLFAAKALTQLLQGQLSGPAVGTAAQVVEQLVLAQEILTRYADNGRRPGPGVGPMDLVPAVDAGVRLLAHRAELRRVRLDWTGAEAMVAVVADPVAVQQVTVNLVANALDAAHSAVSVRLEGTVLVVSDDGSGVCADVAETLFEPFVTTKPPGEGTGLGLALTRTLVVGMGGDLTWTSGPRGSTFRARFQGVDQE